jgi:nucleoside 2-deoxyribosyltransferase
MKTIYLSGPISGQPDGACKGWRALATKALSSRYKILDPMRRDMRGREDGNAAQIVSQDLFDVRASDIVLVNANPALDSWGTPMEVYEHYQTRKMVVAFRDPAHVKHPWVVMHSHYIAPDLEGAVAFLLLGAA